MASAVGLMIRGRDIRLDDLLELREAIEPIAARLAARDPTDDDVLRVHERVTTAIREQDSQAAERRVTRHMHALQERAHPS